MALPPNGSGQSRCPVVSHHQRHPRIRPGRHTNCRQDIHLVLLRECPGPEAEKLLLEHRITEQRARLEADRAARRELGVRWMWTSVIGQTALAWSMAVLTFMVLLPSDSAGQLGPRGYQLLGIVGSAEADIVRKNGCAAHVVVDERLIVAVGLALSWGQIGRKTQQVLRDDPVIYLTGGPGVKASYYVEKLTADLAAAARKLIDEVEEMGGMTRAVESGVPKMRIEEAAARRQARIDRGEEVIVGVNKYRAKDEAPVEIRDIDNSAVRESQVARLEKVRAGRNEEACRAALAKLTEAAQDKTGNLLELAIIAARERATVGEISDALEDVYGRYRAMTRSISGVYGAAYENDESFQAIWKDVEAFAEKEGRRPRMLVCKLGQDGHDRGAKVIATGFADLGFDVDIGPLFQTPEEAVREAIENDVHVVGISSQAELFTRFFDSLSRAGG